MQVRTDMRINRQAVDAVLTLWQTADRASLEKLATLLDACDPPAPYHLWVEQPEDVPTCLALAPNRRGDRAVRRVLDKAGCRVWRS